MKNIKKILALVLAVMMLMAMAVTAHAASITISRDSSYAGTGDGRTYSYYKVFSASYESNTSSGGGSTDGAPGNVTGTATGVSYTATAAVAAKLGTWDAETKTWTKASGNLWFKLTPIAGSAEYSVEWDNTAEDSAAAQAAAAWLLENSVYESGPVAMTFSGSTWTSGDIAAGYYLISSNTGNNLVAATTDITVNEKNTYPPLDKTQADEDDTTQSDDARDVAIGDVLNYEVKVTIPATAKVGDEILVWDKATSGLTYNNDVAVKTNAGNATVAAATPEAGQAWAQKITITEGSQGKDVVFAFSMTVNSSALVETAKENTSGLKYGRDGDWTYESLPDRVEYKTYFAGIHKIDGTSKEDLEGVKFELKENGVAFNVTKVEGKDYYIPGGESNEVVTDKDGMIRIRGLDKDKTYTLTETETLPGYNMLDSDVTLTLHEDTCTTTTTDTEGTTTTTTASSYDGATDESWDEVENNQGSLLPSTGGIGKEKFIIGGSVLALAAAILLVTKRRMNSTHNDD